MGDIAKRWPSCQTGLFLPSGDFPVQWHELPKILGVALGLTGLVPVRVRRVERAILAKHPDVAKLVNQGEHRSRENDPTVRMRLAPRAQIRPAVPALFRADDDRLDPALAEISIGVYTVAELLRLLESEGWHAIGAYGSLDGRPYELGDRRLLLIAQRG